MRYCLCSVIILAGCVFLIGCSDDIVYNDTTRNILVSKKSAIVGSENNRNIVVSTAGAESEIFTGVNRIRQKHQLQTLVRKPELDKIARIYSRKMAQFGEISHSGVTGEVLEERLESAGLTQWTQAGENLAYNSAGAEPAQSALWGWQQSPEHMENMLFSTFVYTGIGVVRDAKGDYYTTQLFLTP